MGEKELLLKKAWQGLNHLLSIGHIDETFIDLLYFIKNINEDNNLVIGLSDKETQELFDEENTGKPETIEMRGELLEQFKNMEKSMVISVGDFDLDELIKKLFGD